MTNKCDKSYFILVTPELNVPSYTASGDGIYLNDLIKLPVWIKWISYLDVIFTRPISDRKFYYCGILFNSISISIIERNEICRIINEDVPEKFLQNLNDLGLNIVGGSQYRLEYENLVIQTEQLSKQIETYCKYILELSGSLISFEEKVKSQVEQIKELYNKLSVLGHSYAELEHSYYENELKTSNVVELLNKRIDNLTYNFNYNELISYIDKLSNIVGTFTDLRYDYDQKHISINRYKELLHIVNKLKSIKG